MQINIYYSTGKIIRVIRKFEKVYILIRIRSEYTNFKKASRANSEIFVVQMITNN